jgi:hypothetical protein
MQYLKNDIPRDLDCCAPLEYPVEIALGTIDFLMEDVNGAESALTAYYRLLNCGFRPGLAAATDFPCNHHEPIGTQLTYVRIPDGKLSYRGWIDGIAAGHTVVSRNAHGEFLDLKVDGKAGPGDEISLSGKGSVPVDVRWSAAMPFGGRIELIRNGVLAASVQAPPIPRGQVVLHTRINFDESGWLAARRVDAKGHHVHTGAVYVTVNRAPVRASAGDAKFFVRFIDNLIRQTSPGGDWSSFFAHDREAAQARYRRAKAVYERIAAEASRQTAP